MSADLVLLVLIGMAAIVWSACFVGCAQIVGIRNVSPFDQFQSTILGTSGLVAFWPLNDTSGTTAADIGPNNFNGTYTIGPTGTYTLGQPNIVAGDTAVGNPNTPSPCVLFEGGYVNVSHQPALGPPQFTIEAWVTPNWSSSDMQTRGVVVSAAAADFAGFSLFATTDNLWSVQLGIGSKFVPVTTGSNQTIVQGSLYFLVVTYDGITLTLWVNPADTMLKIPVGASGYVPVPSSIPFFIGMARPDENPPMYPFDGWIQDVAFYNTVLDDTTIQTHYANGSGMTIT